MATKWDDTMNLHLFESIYLVATPTISKELQTAIVDRMAAQGYDINWNSIRYSTFVLCIIICASGSRTSNLPFFVTIPLMAALPRRTLPLSSAYLKATLQVQLCNSQLLNPLRDYFCLRPNFVTMPGRGYRVLQKWDSAVHEDILIAFKDALQPTPDDWNKIMQELSHMGHSFTESALKYALTVSFA
jgi:hypothetical protein